MRPKYNQERLNQEIFKTWVAQDKNDETKGFCKYCRCSLFGKLYDLLNQAEV